MARRHSPAFICPRLCTPRAFDMFSYIAGPCRFCVHCRVATYARVVGLCGFRMHCGIYRICAYCAPLPCLRAPWGGRLFHMCRGLLLHPCLLWDSTAFACAGGLCRTHACFRISPLSHVPRAFAALVPVFRFAAFACAVGLCRTVPALGFRRFRMCRGHLPHRACFGISPLSHVPWAFAAPVPVFGISPLSHVPRPLPRPYLLWNFATFACTAGLYRDRVHLGHCHVHACVLTLLLQVPQSFDVYLRTAAFM